MNQHAGIPRQQRRHDMAAPLARPGAAGHETGTEVCRCENASSENAEDASAEGRQPGGLGVFQLSPAPDPSMGLVTRKRPQPQPPDAADKDQRCAPRHDGLRLGAEGIPPLQDGPGRIEGKVGGDAPGRSQSVGPLVGPGEHLRRGLGAHGEAEPQSCQLGPHLRSPEAGHPGQPQLRGSAKERRPFDGGDRRSMRRPNLFPTTV